MVSLKTITFVAASLAAVALAQECTEKVQRRAWHTFTSEEKKAYIDAELCLMETPATLGLPGARTRFDELQANHQIQANITHGVGAFLPYHRVLMRAHEYFLHEDCGYEGAQPYWDEPLDAGNFTNSVVLDVETGFGGDGVGDDNCIVDGPFANYTNSLGPGYEITDHCIDRKISDQTSQSSAQSFVDECLEMETFEDARNCFEGRPHAGGHGGIGGEMLNPISSPGDPVFYLHHTWLDKIWWQWQAMDLEARLVDISGPNIQDPKTGFGPPGGGDFEIPGLPKDLPEIPEDWSYPGDEGNITSLTHVISTLGLLPNVTIADVMDIGGGFLCYEYV